MTGPEPAVPPQAITESAAFHAVANVIHQRYCNHRKKGRSCSGPTNGERAVAQDALEAAAPHLAAAERERIREYVARRREGLNDEDPYERGKDMAYLGILDHLAAALLREAWRQENPAQHLGYACACPEPSAPTRPALVVDPFGGTGTTALVASVLGRHAVTADLSADYCRLAAWRTTDPGERARAMQVPKPPPVPDGQAALFALEAT